MFTATRARGRVGGAGVDVSCSDHRSGLLAVASLLPRSLLILVLMLVLVIMPRSVHVVHTRPVLIPILVLHLLQTVIEDRSIRGPVDGRSWL
jgi:hypothetical protein